MLLLLPAAVYSEPKTRINYVYYTVGGDSAEAIWADTLAKTPVAHEGRRHVGYTRWHVNWQFWWQDKGDSCEISTVKTRLDVSYTLPRLRPDDALSDQTLARWNRFYDALFSHEQGHKKLGTEAALAIEKRIAGMGARRNCEQLEREANAIAHSVIEEYSRLEKEYDKSTNHGVNTGATFP